MTQEKTYKELMKEYGSMPHKRQSPKKLDKISKKKSPLKTAEVRSPPSVDNINKNTDEEKIKMPKKKKQQKEEIKDAEFDELPPLDGEPKPKIDENKDYCNNCYENNNTLIEIKKTDEKCPSCGIELDWSVEQ